MSEKSNLLARTNTKLGLDKDTHRGIIFVYCPPKVGSTSLVSSLRLSATHLFKIFHIHDETMLHILTGISGVSIQEIIDYNSSLGRNVYVIDIYREPLERKMSEYFGKLAAYHFNTSIGNVKKYHMKRLVTRFNQIFPHIAHRDYFYEKNTELTSPPNFTFNFNTGYIVQKQENITYLKIRLRDSAEWGRILKEVLGAEITIIKDYQRDNLALGDVYKAFKAGYRVPSNFIAHMQADPHFKFYLSPTEQAEYVSKLTGRSTDDFSAFSVSDYKVYSTISDENQSVRDIEADHYFDEGCSCNLCSAVRRMVLVQIKNKMTPKFRITHPEAVSMAANKSLQPYLTPTDNAIASRNYKVQYSTPAVTLKLNRFRR